MGITSVLFDIGNVLTDDGHDTYLTHSEHGLLRPAGPIDAADALALTAPTFRKYAVQSTSQEADFWRDINTALRTRFTPQEIAKAKRSSRAINPETLLVFKILKQRGITIGVISNSLSFLYQELSKELLLDDYADKSLCFLSHQTGVLKSNGLFELAAHQLQPECTLIIEDRNKNVTYARSLGFTVVEYSFSSGALLSEAVTNGLKIMRTGTH